MILPHVCAATFFNRPWAETDPSPLQTMGGEDGLFEHSVGYVFMIPPVQLASCMDVPNRFSAVCQKRIEEKE